MSKTFDKKFKNRLFFVYFSVKSFLNGLMNPTSHSCYRGVHYPKIFDKIQPTTPVLLEIPLYAVFYDNKRNLFIYRIIKRIMKSFVKWPLIDLEVRVVTSAVLNLCEFICLVLFSSSKRASQIWFIHYPLKDIGHWQFSVVTTIHMIQENTHKIVINNKLVVTLPPSHYIKAFPFC